jgi:hypothetical protein
LVRLFYGIDFPVTIFYSIAQQLNFTRQAIHPLPRFPREVYCRPDALVDCYPFFSGNQIVSMRDDLFFHCHGYAVAGRQSKERTFISSETSTGVTFNNAGDLLAKTPCTYKIGPALGMTDIMGPAPADIMEHRTLFHEMKIDTGIMRRIPAGTVPYCMAVGNDFCAAPGIKQQAFAGFFLFFRHGQATS